MHQIAYITDIHLDESFPSEYGVRTRENWLRILKDVKERKIHEIVYGGDIGEKTSHPWFFDSLQYFKLSITLGNHDQYSQVRKHFRNGFIPNREELFYTCDENNFGHIFLDSSAGQISETQLEWLKGQLLTERKCILFVHHPVFEVDTAVDKLYALQQRKAVQQILLDCGKPIQLFCAHYHMDAEVIFRNVHQLITPAASFQIVKDAESVKIDNNTFGYRIITLRNDRALTELVMFSA